jgi:hypothetical protein
MKLSSHRPKALRHLSLLVLMLLAAACSSSPATPPDGATGAQQTATIATDTPTTPMPATDTPVAATDAPTPASATDTPVAAADTPSPAPATAVAATETPTTLGAEVVLDGGVRISYTNAGGAGATLFRVDELAVYRSFTLLRQDWAARGGSPTLVMVLTETAPQSDLWVLRYASPLSSTLVVTPEIVAEPVTPIGWSEFTLSSVYTLGSSSDQPLTFGPIQVDETPSQVITQTEIFTPIAGEAFPDALANLPNTNLVRKLLIREISGEQARYTLAIVDPTTGAGTPPRRGWCNKQPVQARRGICRKVHR